MTWFKQAQDLKIQLKFKIIFWIRFEVLFKANIERYISRVSSLDKA
jgi:hypothetical protein